MKTKKQRSESSSPRAKVLASLMRTSLGAVTLLASAILGTAMLNVSEKWGAAATAAGSSVMVSAMLTILLVRLERGSSQIASFKDKLVNAYLGALESSPLNPLRGGQR